MKILLGALLILDIYGCGTANFSPDSEIVRGTVLFEGKPIPMGNIDFEPADGIGPAASGIISNGSFEFSSPPGEKKVMIYASRKTGKKGEEFGNDLMESYIPVKYNSKSELKKTVRPDSENVFEFDLKEANE